MRGMRTLGMAALLASAISAPAFSAPITTPPPTLSVNGDVIALYVFADAADVSNMGESGPVSIPLIFSNGTNSSGDHLDLGNQVGNMVFTLNDTANGNAFLSNTADSDGNFHVLVSTNFADFGVNGGVLPTPALLFEQANPTLTWTYIGWEDRMVKDGSDFDYNDLIFAFSNLTIVRNVPEPITLSLMGAGLAGLGALRRRRKSTPVA